MKRLVFPLLVLLALFARVDAWRRARNRADDLCSRLLGSTVGRRIPRTEVEGAPVPEFGGWRLEDPRVAGDPFAGEIHIGPEVLGRDPEPGRRVGISGRFRCTIDPRNPGRMEDFFPAFRARRLYGSGPRFHARYLPAPSSFLWRSPLAFRRWLSDRFRAFPDLLAWEEVIWAGDERGLPARVREYYREGGLVHLMALSGARVAALVSLLTIALSTLERVFAPRGERWIREVRRILPLTACLTLYLTSAGAAPVRRMLPMALTFLALRLLRWETSRLQSTASAVAIAIVAEPDLVARPGFLLSAVGTAVLLQLVSGAGGRRGIAGYFAVVTLMPVLVFPLGAFFFAKVGWLAPLHCLLLNWLWDFFLVPLGLLLPLFPTRLFLVLQCGWRIALELQLALAARLGVAYHSVIRPTLGETIAIEIVLLHALCGILRIARWRDNW